MRQLRIVVTASLLCAALGCRSEDERRPTPISPEQVEEAKPELDCGAASHFVTATFRSLRDRPDPAVWPRLASNFEGELAKDVARVGERLNHAAMLNSSADSLIRAAGEPHNRGRPRPSAGAEAGKPRTEARQPLAELEVGVARIVARVAKLPAAACRRGADAKADGAQR